MEMWIKTFWPIAWAVLSTLGMLVLALLSKTYAKRDDLAKVEKKVDELKAHVDSLPTQKQITNLLIALERTNGRMESLEAKIQPVQHLARLLLQQRLNDEK
jgi:predicted  nucleic acid-binding Zn-ribbon protein